MSTIDYDYQLINTNVAFIHCDAPMTEAIQKLVENKISSLIVYDHQNHAVGILTERDIVRKFTPLILNDKMTRSVSTIMTRPLVCASANNFDEDIPRLHAELGIRHFPLVRGDLVTRGAPLVPDVVGFISVTDLARQYLYRLAREASKRRGKPLKAGPAARPLAKSPNKTRPALSIICKSMDEGNFYQKIFEQLEFKVSVEQEFTPRLSRKFTDDSRILVDLDSFSTEEQRHILQGLPHWPGRLVIATGREELLPVFRKHLHGHHQHVALKPLNLPHCAWLFAN
jgi:CBS domain-containing protein